MAFEWDQGKSTANKEKHGIYFDTARMLWSDDNRLEIHPPDPVEERWIIIGKIDNREAFEERPILAKYKEGDNFNRRNTLSISRIEI